MQQCSLCALDFKWPSFCLTNSSVHSSQCHQVITGCLLVYKRVVHLCTFANDILNSCEKRSKDSTWKFKEDTATYEHFFKSVPVLISIGMFSEHQHQHHRQTLKRFTSKEKCCLSLWLPTTSSKATDYCVLLQKLLLCFLFVSSFLHTRQTPETMHTVETINHTLMPIWLG